MPDQPTCRYCGGVFELTRYWRDFCSADCRNDWHERERKLAMADRKKKMQKLHGDGK